MPKSYEWLAAHILSPHKIFGYFIKCLANCFSIAKQITEKKRRRNRKEKPLAILAQRKPQPAQPSSPACRLPPRGSKQLAGAGARAVDAEDILDPPPCSSVRHATPLVTPSPSPSLCFLSLSLS